MRPPYNFPRVPALWRYVLHPLFCPPDGRCVTPCREVGPCDASLLCAWGPLYVSMYFSPLKKCPSFRCGSSQCEDVFFPAWLNFGRTPQKNGGAFLLETFSLKTRWGAPQNLLWRL